MRSGKSVIRSHIYLNALAGFKPPRCEDSLCSESALRSSGISGDRWLLLTHEHQINTASTFEGAVETLLNPPERSGRRTQRQAWEPKTKVKPSSKNELPELPKLPLVLPVHKQKPP